MVCIWSGSQVEIDRNTCAAALICTEAVGHVEALKSVVVLSLLLSRASNFQVAAWYYHHQPPQD